MVKEWSLLEGKTLRGEAERPLGETKALVIGEVKLDLSWLAIGEAVAMANGFAFRRETSNVMSERE
jgi:hypothetical protein